MQIRSQTPTYFNNKVNEISKETSSSKDQGQDNDQNEEKQEDQKNNTSSSNAAQLHPSSVFNAEDIVFSEHINILSHINQLKQSINLVNFEKLVSLLTDASPEIYFEIVSSLRYYLFHTENKLLQRYILNTLKDLIDGKKSDKECDMSSRLLCVMTIKEFKKKIALES